MVGGGHLFSPKFWVKLTRWSENAYFQSIFARSTSAVTPSEKVQLTQIGSPLRASNKLKINIVPWPYTPKGAQKRETPFSIKYCTSLEESLPQSFFVWKPSATKVVRHSLAYLSVQNRLAWDVSFYVKIWRILTHRLAKRRFSIYFRW